MKIKYWIPILLIVFIFSFTGCTTPKTATETTTAETTITETTAPETTVEEATTKYKIAFMSGRDGNYEIYTMNIDGSEQVRLTDNPADDAIPRFSPIQGTTAPETTVAEATAKGKIAFYSDRDGNLEIYIMNVDGLRQEKIYSDPALTAVLSFSPDGSKIAFTSDRDGNNEIITMNIDGSGQINLTNNPADDWWPSFSPDGSKIAFASNRDGNYEIYTMNVDGSGQTNLTNNPAVDTSPSFSP